MGAYIFRCRDFSVLELLCASTFRHHDSLAPERLSNTFWHQNVLAPELFGTQNFRRHDFLIFIILVPIRVSTWIFQPRDVLVPELFEAGMLRHQDASAPGNFNTRTFCCRDASAQGLLSAQTSPWHSSTFIILVP